MWCTPYHKVYLHYKTADQLINELNKLNIKDPETGERTVEFRYDELTRKVTVYVYADDAVVTYSDGLSLILGFPSDESIIETVTASRQINLEGMCHHIFIHTDVIEEQIIGSLKTALLKTILTTDIPFGSFISHEVDPQYLNVRNKSFEVIKVWITDIESKPIDFFGGHTMLQLHFIQA